MLSKGILGNVVQPQREQENSYHRPKNHAGTLNIKLSLQFRDVNTCLHTNACLERVFLLLKEHPHMHQAYTT